MVAMTFRGRRRLLWTLNLGLAAGIVCCLLGAVLLPPGIEMSQPTTKHVDATDLNASSAVKPLSVYVALSSRDLRKPLFDDGTGLRAADKPKLALKLLGTVLDPGRNCGIFLNKSGQTKFIKVGETLDGAEITALNDQTATVLFHGETIILEVSKKGGQP